MPEFTKLWSRPSEAILVWPGEDPLVVKYDSEEIWLPPRFEAAKPGLGSPYRLPSAADSRGNLLRGTVLVKDVTIPTDTGGYKLIFSVNDMCSYLTRDRDDLFRRGFNIVASPDQVRTAMEMGLPLYEASQDDRAREILSKEMDRRRKYEERKEPVPRSSSEHLIAWAITHMQKRAPQKPMHTSEQIIAALEGRYIAAAPAATIPLEASRSGYDLYREAKELKVQLSKVELEACLDGNDEEQLRFVTEKIAARRAALLEKRLDREAEEHQQQQEEAAQQAVGEASD